MILTAQFVETLSGTHIQAIRASSWTMPPDPSDKRPDDSLEGVTLVEQQNVPRDSESPWLETHSFDEISFLLVFLASVVFPALLALASRSKENIVNIEFIWLVGTIVFLFVVLLVFSLLVKRIVGNKTAVVSLFLLAKLFFISAIISLKLESGDIALATIAAVSAVFALLSVRENIRTRNANFAPELLFGVRDRSIGIANVGEGPAHELTVNVSIEQDGKAVNENPDDAIVLVDNFHEIERKDWEDNGEELKSEDLDCFFVNMEYASGVGQGYCVTRKVTGTERVKEALPDQ